ncbi:MAG: pyridoxal-dependent decarboxylase [Thermoanaerobaculia bacterium]
MDAATFRKLGHETVEWVAAYRERMESLPVMSASRPGQIRAAFPAEAPRDGGALPEALAQLDALVLPGITHWNHPSFFAYFPSNTSYASVLADLVAAGLGAQGMSWQTSPAATEIEEVVMDWLRQMVGLAPEWKGVVHDTASTATLCALLCARERASSFSQNRGGLQGLEAPLTVYLSSQAHSSVEKAALLAGFGRENLRYIDTDEVHAMRVDLLEQAIATDLLAGCRPCAIVVSIGTTGTTAIDPLEAIAGVAQMSEMAGPDAIWLHVDAAMAGTAMVLPECRPLWYGVERADSLVFNPHKWMGVGCDFSAYYVRDAEHLIRVMSTNPTYLRTAEDGAVTNYRDWQIPLGRRFRALKLWFFLLDIGVDGLQARLRRDLANAQWLKEQVDAAPDWERMAPVPLQTVCVRHVPTDLAGDELALTDHNLAIARSINDSGVAYLTPSDLKGRQMLRLSIGAEATERQHVEALWAALQSAAADGRDRN